LRTAGVVVASTADKQNLNERQEGLLGWCD
jgi:hypothetical protein